MSYTVLLYGATGSAGRLIAAEAELMWHRQSPRPFHMVLAGRDEAALQELERKHQMSVQVFGLDDEKDLVRQLEGVDVVINAAGPFAWTAERLANAAVAAGSHYVDVNEEVDVYKRVDDFDDRARDRCVAIVCSAGYRASASDLLLDAALDQLVVHNIDPDSLGTIRIATSGAFTCSRGSVATALRMLREQVMIVRSAEKKTGNGKTVHELALWHEPVGKLEHVFDFAPRSSENRDRRIASAANLVDTLTARLTVTRPRVGAPNGMLTRRIESYVATGAGARMALQVGALVAPFAALPLGRALLRAQTRMLPDIPVPERQPPVTLLEIEDCFRTKLIDWRLQTPDSYRFTAQVVVEIASQLMTAARTAAAPVAGVITPAQVLRRLNVGAQQHAAALRGCILDARYTATT